MSAMNDGWYVADADGNTEGPMTREELETRRLRGAFPPDALAWHLDISEWRPLASTAAVPAVVEQNLVAKPAPARTQNAATASGQAGDKAERKRKAREAMAQRAASSSVQATNRRENQDSGARLLSHAAQGGAAARGTQAPAKAEPAAAAAQSSARAGVAMRRFIARLLDTTTLGMLGAVALWAYLQREVPGVLGPATEAPTVLLLLILAVVALAPLEAIALAVAGTTPGKALLGLRVLRGGSGRPTPVQALKRSIDVAWRGMALGIPVLSLVTAVVAGGRYINSGAMRWDANAGLETHAAPIPGARWQMALAAGFGSFLLLSSPFWPELALQLLNRL